MPEHKSSQKATKNAKFCFSLEQKVKLVNTEKGFVSRLQKNCSLYPKYGSNYNRLEAQVWNDLFIPCFYVKIHKDFRASNDQIYFSKICNMPQNEHSDLLSSSTENKPNKNFHFQGEIFDQSHRIAITSSTGCLLRKRCCLD